MLPKKLIGWVDSHCHLEMIPQPITEILAANKRWNVQRVVSIGTCLKNNQAVLHNCENFDEVYGTLGLHPNYVEPAAFEYLTQLEKMIATNPKIVAIGECGYDFFRQQTNYEEQKQAFEQQLNIAASLHIPVVVHSRQADEQTLSTLKKFKNKEIKIVLHSYTGGQELFNFGIDQGYYFSFNGIATFKKSDDIREYCKKVPQNRILLETDSPYLAPGKFRGKTNIPAYVAHTGELLAKELDISADFFQQITRDNTLRFYDRMPAL